MRPDDLKSWLKRTPFEPFTLEITNGERVTIDHPEQLWVGRSACFIGIFDRDELLERTMQVALIHVVKVEPARRSGARRKNGN